MIATVTKSQILECPICSTQFKRKNSEIIKAKTNCCSLLCARKYTFSLYKEKHKNDTHKKCCVCKTIKLICKFGKNKNHWSGISKCCIECARKLGTKNRKKENKKLITLKAKFKRLNDKLKLIERYGGRCVCCGEDNIYFLQLDHINNNGAEERRSIDRGSSGGHKFYEYLRKNNYPDGYQILCANCNQAKAYFGICSHQLSQIEIEKEKYRVAS